MEENYVIGTCLSMCPLREAKLREKEKLLHKFEMKTGSENSKRPEFDPEKVIKSFSRSAAGMDTTNPSNLRPFPVLMNTIEYMYTKIFPIHQDKPLLVYNFMFDRFRAIRQDAVIQNLPPNQMIQILEPLVRFFVYFGYILSEKSIDEFDSQINNTHLQECLKRLLVCYSESQECESPCRWQMESCYLLFNLGNIKALTRGVNLCNLKPSQEFLFSLDLSVQWYIKNYVRVLKMIVKLPVLLVLVASNWISDIRRHILKALCYCYSSPNSSYPVERLQSLMLYENESQVVEQCKCFNIKISSGKVCFLKKENDFSGECKVLKMSWVDEDLHKYDLVQLLCFGIHKSLS